MVVTLGRDVIDRQRSDRQDADRRTSPLQGPAGWRTWVCNPAPEAAPTFSSSDGKFTIRLANDPASFGKWISPTIPVAAGKNYSCRVWCRTDGVPVPETSALAVLTWRGEIKPGWPTGWRVADVDRGRDPGLGAPVLVDRRFLREVLVKGALTAPDDRPGWRLLEIVLPAPAVATAAEVELWLRIAPGGEVQWSGAELTEAPARPPRLVTLGTIRAVPPAGGTLESNRALLADLADRAAAAGAEIVCLPETATYHGTGLSSAQAAEPLHGPTAEILGRVAARRNIWIVAQYPEQEQHRRYNTVVLIDREGRISAKYHKMHLTTAEQEGGMIPGEGPVVADTDFGRVGLLVCYDLHFPEASRVTSKLGAEVIFGPTAGDRWEEKRHGVNRGHAISNGVFLVTSLVSQSSDIVDPEGRFLASATEPNSFVTARVDLDYKDTVEGRAIGPAGGMHRDVYWANRRLDVYAEVEGLGPAR